MSCAGVGLHSGQPVTLTLKPATPNTGVVFVNRNGKDGASLAASVKHLVPTELCTAISGNGFQVQTIEHVIDHRDWQQGLTEMAHDLLVADKEYVMIGRFRKSCKPLAEPGTPPSWPQQLRPGVQLNESFPNGQNGGLRAIVDLELMKDVPHVVLDGLFAQVQVVGDFLVRLAICNQAEDRDLSFRQIVLDPSRLFPLLLGHQGKLRQNFARYGWVDQ